MGEVETLREIADRNLTVAGGPVKTPEDIESEFFSAVDGALVNSANVYYDSGYNPK